MDRPPAKHLYIAYLLGNYWQWLFYSDFLLDEVIPFTQHLKKLPLFLLRASPQAGEAGPHRRCLQLVSSSQT